MAPSHWYRLLPALVALAACDSPLDALSDASLAPVDARVVDARPGEEIDAAPLVDGPKPIMKAAANYLEFHDELAGLGPFQVYAWATDPAISNPNRYQQELGYLQQIDEPGVEEMIMFSSHATLAQKLAIPGHAQELKDLGVSILGYNTEGFMTPAGEMNGIGNPSAEQNPIARYASLAAAEGFETFWGPIRVTADAVSSDAIAAMKLGGLSGVALQEQQFSPRRIMESR